jgi:hypothetical protein
MNAPRAVTRPGGDDGARRCRRPSLRSHWPMEHVAQTRRTWAETSHPAPRFRPSNRPRAHSDNKTSGAPTNSHRGIVCRTHKATRPPSLSSTGPLARTAMRGRPSTARMRSQRLSTAHLGVIMAPGQAGRRGRRHVCLVPAYVGRLSWRDPSTCGPSTDRRPCRGPCTAHRGRARRRGSEAPRRSDSPADHHLLGRLTATEVVVLKQERPHHVPPAVRL